VYDRKIGNGQNGDKDDPV